MYNSIKNNNLNHINLCVLSAHSPFVITISFLWKGIKKQMLGQIDTLTRTHSIVALSLRDDSFYFFRKEIKCKLKQIMFAYFIHHFISMYSFVFDCCWMHDLINCFCLLVFFCFHSYDKRKPNDGKKTANIIIQYWTLVATLYSMNLKVVWKWFMHSIHSTSACHWHIIVTTLLCTSYPFFLEDKIR